MPKPEMAKVTLNQNQERSEQAHALVREIYRSEQLDLLHLAVINLLDMVKDEEIDLVLDQDNKSLQQKKLFLQKLTTSLNTPILQKEFERRIKAEDWEFFREKELGPFLQSIQHAANNCSVVKLTLALEFKESDVKEMSALLSERLGKQAVLSIKVDATLLGGAIVQQGSFQNDYTLKTQLDLYRSKWHKAVIEKG